MGYAYLVTPAGVAEKSKLIAESLSRKLVECEAPNAEIEVLKMEMNSEKGGMR